MKFKQVFGFVLLFGFLGFMGHKFSNNIGGIGVDDGLMITLFSIIIILLIIVFVLQILRS